MDGTIGEIKLWGGQYTPRNWAACNGQLMAVSESTAALYSLLGNTYGGRPNISFALPDLRGRVIVGNGESKSNTNYQIGSSGGRETVALTIDQMPNHQHSFMVSNKSANYFSPSSSILSAPSDNVVYYLPEDPGEEKILPLQEDVLQETGEGFPHNNMMSYVVLNYIICTQGTFPKVRS